MKNYIAGQMLTEREAAGARWRDVVWCGVMSCDAVWCGLSAHIVRVLAVLCVDMCANLCERGVPICISHAETSVHEGLMRFTSLDHKPKYCLASKGIGHAGYP